jgi:copper chaperone
MTQAMKLEYVVAGMSCGHCVNAVSSEVRQVPGVGDVQIDLDTKAVVVTGSDLDDAALRAAIVEAGYEAA